ncbi:hypothetical protein KCP78_23040 [Salmonella enterica subsp. enterica]|nr:hypothetical protein KCP78_23040 [Salmonella enterica subsp. enterica]
MVFPFVPTAPGCRERLTGLDLEYSATVIAAFGDCRQCGSARKKRTDAAARQEAIWESAVSGAGSLRSGGCCWMKLNIAPAASGWWRGCGFITGIFQPSSPRLTGRNRILLLLAKGQRCGASRLTASLTSVLIATGI